LVEIRYPPVLSSAAAGGEAVTWLLAVSMLAEGGSGLAREDWFARIPLALTVFGFVAVVDAIVFTRIIRRMRRGE
jgi:hypothetical protein